MNIEYTILTFKLASFLLEVWTLVYGLLCVRSNYHGPKYCANITDLSTEYDDRINLTIGAVGGVVDFLTNGNLIYITFPT